MQMHVVAIKNPEEKNIIFGQSHFIKTVEDLHEALVTSAMGIKFGIAFCEASGERLIRHSGNDAGLEALAVENMQAIGAGHSFLVMMDNAFPIHVMHAVRAVPEICRIYCATSNPVEVIVAQTELGRGVMGVVDGMVPLGVEDDAGQQKRKGFLRMIGYKA